jgi:signal transduction histidine kinase
LLAAARPSDPDAQLAPVNVATTIEDVVALVRAHIERDHVRLIVRLPEEPLPMVLAVPGELDDVWLNLLLNAHDALRGRPDPEIGIAVSYVASASILDVQVWDNGGGIPEAVVNDIFKPFFTTKPAGEGTGLGLHICRQVVERAGGTITVESVPGEGTSFLVRLPVIREV